MKILKKLSDVSPRLWLWLFPITYLIHILEEYYGGEGYSAHLLRTKGIHLSPERFRVAQTIGVALMLLGVLLARRFKASVSMATVMGTVVLVNALTHIVNSLRNLSYEPGLLSSIIIWLPLGLFTLLNFRRYMPRKRIYWLDIGIGLAINVSIAVISHRGGRLF